MFKKIRALFLCFLFTIISHLQALPEGYHLISGDINISSDQSNMIINSGKSTIINWDSFSINGLENVSFNQFDARSAILNRVTGNDNSSILGSITSNGKVYLINPHGILIGQDATIDTSSFIASSFDCLDEDFLKNQDLLFTGNSGDIINLGTISCPTGDIILIGRTITNEGSLSAPKGLVSLASGMEVLLKVEGNEKVFIKPTLPCEETEEGSAIENSGSIQALSVELKTSYSPYAYAIKNSGEIEALTIKEENGKIFLISDDNCKISGSLIADEITISTKEDLLVSGSIDASSVDENSNGGNIKILGKNIYLKDAYVDASSNLNAGEILIGGDYQGSNPKIFNATTLVVDESTVIKADSLQSGNGGKVILWSNEKTGFWGNVSARGGEVLGDGGFVEVSSKDQLACYGAIDAKAFNGNPGEVLFDPKFIIVQFAGIDVPPFTYLTAPAATYTVDPATITGVLNTGTAVALQANTDITINSSIFANNPGGDGGTLSLEAGRSIAINNNITTDNGTLNIYANDPAADGANRDVGAASISATAIVTLNTGTGNLDCQMRNGSTSGDISFNVASEIQSSGTVGISFVGGASGNMYLGIINNANTFTATGNAAVTECNINGDIGQISPLNSFTTISMLSNKIGAMIKTQGAGSINFSGPISLTNFTSLDSSNQAMTLGVLNTVSGNNALQIITGTGTLNLNSQIGSMGSEIFSCSVFGSTINLGNSINTHRALTINGTVLNVTNTATLRVADVGYDVTFNTPISGNNSLTVNTNSNGAINFNDVVGNPTPLSSLTGSSSNIYLGSDITTQGAGSISITGRINLTGPATLTTTNQNISLGPNFGVQGAQVFEIDSGTSFTSLSASTDSIGGVTPLNSFTITSTNPNVNLGVNITTTNAGGGITLPASAINLIGASTLTSGNTVLTLAAANTVDGNQAFGINTGTAAANINGVIGGGTPVGSFTATGSPINVGVNVSAQGGTLTFNSPVVLTAPAIFTDTGNTGILFNSSITGPFDLDILASNGSVSVLGLIDTTSGGAGGNVNINSTANDVLVNAIDTTGAPSGNVTLQPADTFSSSVFTPGDNIPDGRLFLYSDITAPGATILLSDTGRTDLMSVATIVGDLTENNVTIQADTITIGENEAMTVFGNIAFIATTAVTVGDMIALDNLTITAPTINIRLHESEQILKFVGMLYESDNAHILANASAPVLTGTQVFLGTGIDPDIEQLSDFTRAELINDLQFNGPPTYMLNFDRNFIPPSLWFFLQKINIVR